MVELTRRTASRPCPSAAKLTGSSPTRRAVAAARYPMTRTSAGRGGGAVQPGRGLHRRHGAARDVRHLRAHPGSEPQPGSSSWNCRCGRTACRRCRRRCEERARACAAGVVALVPTVPGTRGRPPSRRASELTVLAASERRVAAGGAARPLGRRSGRRSSLRSVRCCHAARPAALPPPRPSPLQPPRAPMRSSRRRAGPPQRCGQRRVQRSWPGVDCSLPRSPGLAGDQRLCGPAVGDLRVDDVFLSVQPTCQVVTP